MTIAQTMAALDVSRQTVLRLMKDGKLTNVAPYNPSLKLQRVRFAAEQVEALRPRPRSIPYPPTAPTSRTVHEG